MNRKLLLLVIVLLAAVALPASWVAAKPAAPMSAELEPNDSIAQANFISIGDVPADIEPVGDVDYFHLSLNAGQRVYLAALADCYPVELETRLALYDAAGTLLVQAEEWPNSDVIFVYTVPATGDYYVRVWSDGGVYSQEELTGPYTLLARLVPPDEPDDHFAPVPVAFGDVIDSEIFAPYDMDYYSVHARPGDVIKTSMTVAEVDPTDGAELRIIDEGYTYPYGAGTTIYEPGTAQVSYIVPFEGNYIVHPSPVLSHCDGLSLPQPYQLTVDRNSLYVAGAKAGEVDGEDFSANDILARNAAGQWRKVFDGEDVGLTATIDAFEWMDDGSLLLSLKVEQTLAGLGKVKPQDILKFTPSQLGEATQGTFAFYLMGSQAGLTTSGEKIDAIALMADGDLLISTNGSFVVPKFGGGTLAGRNEDLILLHPNGLMPSAGSWSLNLDGRGMLPKISAPDLHVASIADDYEGELEPFYHYTYLWFSTDKLYQFLGDDPHGEYKRFTAKPGDLIRVLYYESSYNGPYGRLSWPPLTRTTLAFPRVITSLSIGQGWTE